MPPPPSASGSLGLAPPSGSGLHLLKPNTAIAAEPPQVPVAAFPVAAFGFPRLAGWGTGASRGPRAGPAGGKGPNTLLLSLAITTASHSLEIFCLLHARARPAPQAGETYPSPLHASSLSDTKYLARETSGRICYHSPGRKDCVPWPVQAPGAEDSLCRARVPAPRALEAARPLPGPGFSRPFPACRVGQGIAAAAPLPTAPRLPPGASTSALCCH